MEDITTRINEIKHKRQTVLIKKKFQCESCNKTMIKHLPRLYNTDIVKCSCGNEMKSI